MTSATGEKTCLPLRGIIRIRVGIYLTIIVQIQMNKILCLFVAVCHVRTEFARMRQMLQNVLCVWRESVLRLKDIV